MPVESTPTLVPRTPRMRADLLRSSIVLEKLQIEKIFAILLEMFRNTLPQTAHRSILGYFYVKFLLSEKRISKRLSMFLIAYVGFENRFQVMNFSSNQLILSGSV
jgi:hypothetical protein